jgi:hypothetical protein
MIRFGTRIGARVVFGPAETERRTGQTRVWVRCDCGDVRAVYTHSLVKPSPPMRCARCARRMVSRSRSSSLASTVEIGVGPVPLSQLPFFLLQDMPGWELTPHSCDGVKPDRAP